ncbi:hypothetical protein [Salinibacter phage M31CR41-2]|uniref:Uncharacterized protein n=2 Tax=Kairosalinivirus TaxID=2560158 RepID=A0A2I6UH24_9CAUD|nr:hypothetical protein FGG68_gp04 [Salinibacter phage M31CR41-2]YP_009639620.1 hypothetical protein FGG69_gp08 [Salinibacter phage SRUTV-1]ATU47017.1 hypothetical protein [Salinibacter phage SRUTV-1]AUO79289.1 hypothetical protein [Salinibacter phage M31CR41-2]AUO79359.1 hypothetical protein [Salinibacter virus M31CR41-3]
MRYANANFGKPYEVPYTHRNVPTRGMWHYGNHGQLAFGLIKNEGQAIPQFSNMGKDYETTEKDQEILSEIMRQSCLLALDREPQKFFAKPKELTARMRAARGRVSENDEQMIANALEEADELVYVYFKSGRQMSPASGIRMIDEIVQKRKTALSKGLQVGQIRN